MASEATIGDVLESIGDPMLTTFITNLYDGQSNWRLAVLDLATQPEGLSFLQQNLYSTFIKECQKWAKKGNKRPVEPSQIEKYRSVGTPSGFGKPSGWSRWQKEHSDLPVMCHRPAGHSGVNLLIMHPVFGEIVKILESGEPSSEDYVMAAELCAFMPDAYEIENSRRDDINKILNKYLPSNAVDSIGVRCVAHKFDTDGTCAAAGTNVEYNNEKGKGDADPYMQNIGYFLQYWGNDTAPKAPVKKIAKMGRGRRANISIPGPKQHCCPWMLIEVIGPEIGISCAAYVDETPCAQPLSLNVPFLAVTSDRRLRIHQARLCRAMRYGFNTLKTFYANLPGAEDPQAGFPFTRTFMPISSTTAAAATARVPFSYTKSLIRGEGRMLFVATIDETSEHVLVKFSESYNTKAHMLAAKHGLAPTLRGVEQLDCGLIMIVMDLVADETHHQWGAKGRESVKARSLLLSFQKLFRDNNMVHGDLRPPNLLVVTQDDSDDRLFVVDFDWACQHGTGTYPIAVNPNEEWHEDVEAGKIMMLEHDEFMVERLLSI